MKLLLDEMWSPRIAEQLRRRGHDVVSVAVDKDLVKQSDEFIFAYAQQEQRAIVTENLGHFQALAEEELVSGRSHAGLICTHPRANYRGNDSAIGRMVVALDALLNSNEDLTNQQIWV